MHFSLVSKLKNLLANGDPVAKVRIEGCFTKARKSEMHVNKMAWERCHIYLRKAVKWP